MDFKTELQNLVNRFPGIIKSVKVQFVTSIDVKPNGAPIVQPTIQYPPAPMAPQPASSVGVPIMGGTGFEEGLVPSYSLTPEGLPMKAPKPMPANFSSAQANASSAVQAAITAAKERTIKKKEEVNL